VECFNITSASGALEAIQSQVSFCSSGGFKYCPLLGCVSRTTSCIPLEQCPAARPKRCSFLGTVDGGSPCTPAHVTCTTTGIIQTACPFNQTLCPGGLKCAPGSGASFFQVYSSFKSRTQNPSHLNALTFCPGLHVWRQLRQLKRNPYLERLP
jgi:hypothetical protein